MAEAATVEATGATATPAVSAEELSKLQAQLEETKSKLGEFRNNNTSYLKAKQDAEAAAEKARQEAAAAAAELQKLRDEAAAGKLGTTNEHVEKLLGERYGRALQDREAQIEAERANAKKQAQLVAERDEMIARLVLDNEIATAAGSITGFINDPDVIREQQLVARSIFKVEDGASVARGSDGKPIFGADGVTPLTPHEWLASKKHLRYANVNGGGAAGGSGSGGAKTMSRTEFDALSPGEQSKRMKDGWKVND